MSVWLLDHSPGPLPPLDVTPSGLLIGALIVLAIAVLTIAAANALTRKPPSDDSRAQQPDESHDVWPPPPKS